MASSSAANAPVPADLLKFFFPNNKLIFARAKVGNEGGEGSFLHPDEQLPRRSVAEIYASQPAVIQPRTDWSHWGERKSHYPELGNEDSIKAWSKEVTPAKDFEGGLDQWALHCADLWGLLHGLQEEKYSTGFGLVRFLKMAMSGLRDVVSVATYALPVATSTTKPNSKGTGDFCSPFMAEGIKVPKERPGIGGEPMLPLVFNKRFFVGFIHYSTDVHWASYIWDRKEGHFYVFDTWPIRRRERLIASAAAWREVLSIHGTPYNFAVFGMPVSDQKKGWECGYLAAFLVTITMRGLVGLSSEEMASALELQTFGVSDPSKVPTFAPLALKIRDWQFPVQSNIKKSTALYTAHLSRVKGFIGYAILDELGIRDGQYQQEGQTFHIDKTADTSYAPVDGDQSWRRSDLYTNVGGYRLIRWEGAGDRFLKDKFRLIPQPQRPFGLRLRETIFQEGYPGGLTYPLSNEMLAAYDKREVWYREGMLRVKAPAPTVVTVGDGSPPKKRAPSKKPIPKSTRVLRSASKGPESQPSKTAGTKAGIAARELFSKPAAPGSAVLSVPLGEKATSMRQLIKTIANVDPRERGSSVPPDPSKLQGPAKSDILMTDARSVCSDVSMGGTKSTQGQGSVASGVPDPLASKKKRPHAAVPAVIEGAQEITMTEERIRDDRAAYDEVAIRDAAKVMTVKTDAMKLPRIPDRKVQYIPKTQTFAEYVPEGLVALDQWEDIINAAYDHVFPPPPPRMSRAERYARRQASREG